MSTSPGVTERVPSSGLNYPEDVRGTRVHELSPPFLILRHREFWTLQFHPSMRGCRCALSVVRWGLIGSYYYSAYGLCVCLASVSFSLLSTPPLLLLVLLVFLANSNNSAIIPYRLFCCQTLLLRVDAALFTSLWKRMLDKRANTPL